MSRSIDTDSRLAAADPARGLAIDESTRDELWRRLLAEDAAHSERPPARRRRRAVRRPMLLIAPLLLLLAAGALAAGGVIEFGSPAKLPFSLLGNAREGSGSLAPGTARLLPIHAPDPAGGPDWGMRVLATTRGEGCIQIGRLLDGKLGAIGQDGAFGNDGRFHVLPVSAAFNSIGCALLDGNGRLFTNVTADARPASGWIGAGGRLGGCVPATAGPYEKGLRLTRRERAEGARPAAICRQSDLRNIYYGLLGPQATSITYKLDGERRTLATIGADGAYMFVTRASPHQLLNFANAGTSDVVPVDGPIEEIHYRGGATCHLTAKSWIGGADACTPPLSEPVGFVPAGSAPTPAQVASPIHARLTRGRASRTVIVVSFTARVAVSDARRAYTLRWREAQMPPGAYGGAPIDYDIKAGTIVTRTIGAYGRRLRAGLSVAASRCSRQSARAAWKGPAARACRSAASRFACPETSAAHPSCDELTAGARLLTEREALRSRSLCARAHTFHEQGQPMKIHAIQTGAVRLKHSFLFPSNGMRRQLDLFMPGEWSDPMPILCWAIEHEGLLRLVDTGETAAARNIPFARFEVTREQELPAAFAGRRAEPRRRHRSRADARTRRPHRRARARACARDRQSGRAGLSVLAAAARDASDPAPAAAAGLRAGAVLVRRRAVRRVPAQPRAECRRADRRGRDARAHAGPRLGDLHRRRRPPCDARRRRSRLTRAAARAARRRGRAGPGRARCQPAEDPRSLRAATDRLPALARSRFGHAARRRGHGRLTLGLRR